MSFGYYCSPIGNIKIEVQDKYIIGVDFSNEENINDIKIENYEEENAINRCKLQLEEYFSGKRKNFNLNIKFIGGTDFQKKVWLELIKIPYGTTVTYKEIAERVNNPKGFRAVGGANNKNPIVIIVPCHRVVGSNEKLVGYVGGIDKKEMLLELERKNT